MHIETSRKLFVVSALFAAVGCANPSLLGVSADEHGASAGLTAATSEPLRSATVISGAQDEYLQLQRPSLGDVDGDGKSDFLIDAAWSTPDGAGYGTHSYLFYGKPNFPAQLKTGSADSWFDAGAVPTAALGDIDGDGFADFALGYQDGKQLVFGSATRLTGANTAYATGLRWNDANDTQLYLRKLGDVDADGRAEFLATVISQPPVSELGNRAGQLITDYLIAGRSEDWPSGTWDPSWAVASLGDEPPSFENNGATAVLQRMAVAGCADLDGDGYDDILAHGRWRMWVFYGNASGFHGVLTTEQAAASITWPYVHDDSDFRRARYAKTLPFIIGDVDGDGTADIGVPQGAELGIVYGSKQRLIGHVQLEPQLTIALADDSLPERNWWTATRQDVALGAALPELVVGQIRVGVADLDGDAHPELMLQETRFPSPDGSAETMKFAVYTLTGASKRASGRYVLSDADVYKPSGVSGTDALRQGTLLDDGGDFDGDGSVDLIFGVQKFPASDAQTFLHLVPGAPHAPD